MIQEGMVKDMKKKKRLNYMCIVLLLLIFSAVFFLWLRIGNENLTNLPAGGILSVRGKSGISYFRNPFESAGQDHIWGGGGGYF